MHWINNCTFEDKYVHQEHKLKCMCVCVCVWFYAILSHVDSYNYHHNQDIELFYELIASLYNHMHTPPSFLLLIVLGSYHDQYL